jgi:hypothetical protein
LYGESRILTTLVVFGFLNYPACATAIRS